MKRALVDSNRNDDIGRLASGTESTVVVGGGAAGIAPLCIVLGGVQQPTLATMTVALVCRGARSLVRVFRHR